MLTEKKKTLKILHYVSVLVYITAKSHPRQKSMFPFFLFVKYSWLFLSFQSVHAIPVRLFLGYGDYMSSKYLSSAKLSRKHMPMHLL